MKIIVLGAGHGGLVSAIKLAKNGHDVTVYEKKDRSELGYDWYDNLDKDIFKIIDLELPPVFSLICYFFF